MDANTRKLEAIFDPNISFQVPLFQRPYVWNEADNWEPLWEDIHALLDRQLRTGTSKAHFLGAIVLEQLPHPAGSIETRQVIDGQQRFTTLQLFLMAARNLSTASNAEKYKGRFRRLVENDKDRVEEPHETFKLWPTNNDRAAFKAVHRCGSLKEVEKAVKGDPVLSANRIVEAYGYFHNRLSDWLTGKLDDDIDAQELATKTLEDRLEALWLVVRGGLELVVINLSKDDDAQVIFETLNARGTELLPADLIKNYLFRKAVAQGADVETLYEHQWSRFESLFWREEIKQGRIKRPRIDLFINYYLTLMTRDEIKATHLFNAFKAFVENNAQSTDTKISVPTDAAGHIRQLARYSNVFLKFSEPGDHPALKRFLRRLAAVDTATVYPFMLLAYSELAQDSRDELDRVLLVLESFLMRRLITNGPTKNYNRLFVDLIRAVEKEAPLTAQAVAAHLAKASGDSTKFPTDAELHTVLTERPLYGRIAQGKVRAVLEALDAASQSPKSPLLPLPDDLTVEHVMPQAWEPHWPLSAEATKDPALRPNAVLARELLLNTLGNLTLITGSFNSALQNAAWTHKKPELMKYSKLNLTQYFHTQEAEPWNDAAISLRTIHLYKLLI